MDIAMFFSPQCNILETDWHMSISWFCKKKDVSHETGSNRKTFRITKKNILLQNSIFPRGQYPNTYVCILK